MNSFISDVSQVDEIPDGTKMIQYKNKFCMVRLLQESSPLSKANPGLKYLVRFTEGKTPTENKLYKISYIPISEEEFKVGLTQYRTEMAKNTIGGAKTKKSKKSKK
jgi:hypothetical protein